MKPRRVLIFSLVYYPRFIGGAEVAVKEITDRISPDEIEFDMITLRKHAPKFERVGNVNVHRVGFEWRGSGTKSSKIFPFSKIIYMPWAFLKAVQLHRKNPYDAIWSIMASYAGISSVLFKTFFSETPFILTIQEGDNFERRKGIFGPFFRMIFKKADRITAISNYLIDWSKEMGATCPITLVPNAVDYELFSRPIANSEADQIKNELGKNADDVFLITTSRLVPKNAVNDVVDSLVYLPNNIKFLVLGSGFEKEKLEKQVTALKLHERVKFLGFVSHNDMPKYLQVSDIYIRPSISEGLGNSFLEAMAAGLPVIATPVGGIPDFLKDGETGLFCEPNNPRSIAQKVEKLLKDSESRDYIVRNARIMVQEKFQWEGIAIKMKDILMK